MGGTHSHRRSRCRGKRDEQHELSCSERLNGRFTWLFFGGACLCIEWRTLVRIQYEEIRWYGDDRCVEGTYTRRTATTDGGDRVRNQPPGAGRMYSPKNNYLDLPGLDEDRA